MKEGKQVELQLPSQCGSETTQEDSMDLTDVEWELAMTR